MLRVGAVLGSVPALAFVYTTSSREQRLSSLTFSQSPHMLDWVYPAWCIIVVSYMAISLVTFITPYSARTLHKMIHWRGKFSAAAQRTFSAPHEP